MDNVQTRVEQALKSQLDTMERSYFRKLQLKMYQCSADCCSKDSYTGEDVQRCVQSCAEGPSQVQQYMQQEMQSFENRLSRCVMDCQDQIRDKVGVSPAESEVMKYRGELEACASKCADNALKTLPTMMNRVKDIVKQKQGS